MKKTTLMYGNIEIVELRRPFTLYREDLLPIKEEAYIFAASEEDIQRDAKQFGIDGRFGCVGNIIDLIFDNYVQKNNIKIDDPYLDSDEKLSLIINKANSEYWIRGDD